MRPNTGVITLTLLLISLNLFAQNRDDINRFWRDISLGVRYGTLPASEKSLLFECASHGKGSLSAALQRMENISNDVALQDEFMLTLYKRMGSNTEMFKLVMGQEFCSSQTLANKVVDYIISRYKNDTRIIKWKNEQAKIRKQEKNQSENRQSEKPQIEENKSTAPQLPDLIGDWQDKDEATAIIQLRKDSTFLFSYKDGTKNTREIKGRFFVMDQDIILSNEDGFQDKFTIYEDSNRLFFTSPGYRFQKVYVAESSKFSVTAKELIGCWFMRHDAFLKMQFYQNQTFSFNEYIYDKNFHGTEKIVSGKFQFDGIKVILSGQDGSTHSFTFVVEKRDSSYHLISNGLDYTKNYGCD